MQGLLSGVWGVASLIGPVTGGYITEWFSWRWVFYLNVPFGALTAVAVATALSDRRGHGRHRVDYAGAALLTASVTLLILALSRSGLDTGSDRVAWLMPAYLGAVVCAVLLVKVERQAPEPMVPVDLLADKMVAAIAGTGLLVGVGMFGVIAYVPLFVQEGLGGGAVEAGQALTPLILGWVVTSIITGRVVLKVGYRPLVLAGLACITLAFAGFAWVTATQSSWLLRADLALMGTGMGMGMVFMAE